MVTLVEGSPRDLTCLFEKEGKSTNAQLTVEIKKSKEFDALQKLIPENNIVSQKEPIPGLDGLYFPAPSKKAIITPLKRVQMFIHNISMATSPKFESELETFFANMFCEKTMSSTGLKSNIEDVTVQIKELKVTVKCHNGWTYISDPTPVSLTYKHHGYYASNATITIKDFIPSQEVAMIFELSALAVIQGYDKNELCLGYQIHMPDLGDGKNLQDRNIHL